MLIATRQVVHIQIPYFWIFSKSSDDVCLNETFTGHRKLHSNGTLLKSCRDVFDIT
jgi:hypothetical protein